MKFKLGRLLVTRNVSDKQLTDKRFRNFISVSLGRHSIGDWGDLCEDDKKANEWALKNETRLFSKYIDHEKNEIYIITEADRSVTTILFCSDY